MKACLSCCCEALANIETAIREYFSVVEDLLKDAEVREIELAV